MRSLLQRRSVVAAAASALHISCVNISTAPHKNSLSWSVGMTSIVGASPQQRRWMSASASTADLDEDPTQHYSDAAVTSLADLSNTAANDSDNMLAPADYAVIRTCTPGALLMTVRQDPGMTAVYYARRYFGGADKTALVNSMLWSHLKKYGKVFVQRKKSNNSTTSKTAEASSASSTIESSSNNKDAATTATTSSDSGEVFWFPLNHRCRVHEVRHHREADEDLSLLTHYVPAVPSFLDVRKTGGALPLPPTPPAKMRQQRQEDAAEEAVNAMAREAGEGRVICSRRPAAAIEREAAQFRDAAAARRPSSSTGSSSEGSNDVNSSPPAQAAPKMSPEMQAVVTDVMKVIVPLIAAAPMETMQHYTAQLKDDEQRLAASTAFKLLRTEGKIERIFQPRVGGGGSTAVWRVIQK